MTRKQFNQLKAELRHISDAIGPGSAYELLLPDALETEAPTTVPLHFRLMQILSLLPRRHVLSSTRHCMDRPTLESMQVTLPIPDLFRKVESGRVNVSLGFLTEHLPVHRVGYVPHKETGMQIGIPIAWVHAALWAHEDDSAVRAESRWSRYLN